MHSDVFGHRDEVNDSEIVLLALALQMNLRKPSDIVDPSHPVFPLKDIDRAFRESQKSCEMRCNIMNALKDARGCLCSGNDVHRLRIEEIARGNPA